MTYGDGIRRNVASISSTEKQDLVKAIISLNKDKKYPGLRDDRPPVADSPGGVSYWFKQDEIHQATHVHHGPAFLTWHREMCNRFEDLLRLVNPNLTLHYWDWTTDPRPLFTDTFMGSSSGPAGEPWKTAGFYDESADPYRDDITTHTSPYELHANPADPPRSLERDLSPGKPSLPFTDAEITSTATYQEMRYGLENVHDYIHGYIGGTIGNPHTSFRDPFVFLLHSNVDRLFAMWQWRDPKKKFDRDLVYGSESASTAASAAAITGDPKAVGILTPLEPWAGIHAEGIEKGVWSTRPWARPENEMVPKAGVKNEGSKILSVVIPRLYDTTITSGIRKAHVKEIVPELHVKLSTEVTKANIKEIVPELHVKFLEESKVMEQMPSDLGLFAERLGQIEERLATMESFIRPEERPQLGEKTHKQAKTNDEEQT
jgi:hypothetical protein